MKHKPTLLLLGGIVLLGVGCIAVFYAFAVEISYMDRAEGPPGFWLFERGAVLLLLAGALMVATSLGWWLLRTARWIWRWTQAEDS